MNKEMYENKFYIKILSVYGVFFIYQLVFGIIFDGNLYVGFPIYMSTGGVCLLLLTVFCTKKWIRFFPLLTGLGIALVNAVYMFSSKSLTSLIAMYMCLVLSIVFQRKFIIVMVYLLELITFIIGHNMGITQLMLGDYNDVTGIVIIMCTFTLLMYFLVAQANLAEKMKKEILDEKEELLIINDEKKVLLGAIEEIISKFKQTTINLDHSIIQSQEVSSGTKNVFNTINDKIDVQKDKLSTIKSEVEELDERMQKVASDTKMMEKDTRDSVDNVEEAQKNIEELKENLHVVFQQVNATNEAVKNLIKYSEDIDDVLKTVDHISGQINLLSLNATIEAARAGEYGRGFGVVANEIGMLAEQSKKSTISIRETLRYITGQIDEVSNQVVAISQSSDISNTKAGRIEEVMNNLRNKIETIAEDGISVNTATNYSADFTIHFNSALNMFNQDYLSVRELMQGLMEDFHTQTTMLKGLSEINQEVQDVTQKLEENLENNHY